MIETLRYHLGYAYADSRTMGERRSPKWAALALAHLKKNPRCEACGRKDKLNVHHLLPFHLFPCLELEIDNCLTLCEWPTWNCHLLVGHARNWSNYVPEAALLAVNSYSLIREIERSRILG